MKKKIAIHSVPRSGSTWLGEIVNSNPKGKYAFQPLFSYALKDFLSQISTNRDIELFFRRVEDSKDSFLDQEQHRQDGRLPLFRKEYPVTHIAYKEVRYNHIIENLLEV